MRVGALYAILRLETGAFHGALSKAEGRWRAFGGVLRAGALIAVQAIAVVGAASLAMAANFEQHMNQSLAIMGDVSDRMRTKMETAARAIAKTSTFSAAEAADAYYFLASAGFTAAQSVEALPVVTRFAQAGVMDLEVATELLMDSQTTMGLRSKDATKNMENMARVSDVLASAQIHSNATLQQMAEALTNKAGPALRVVGKDIEEGAAALMVLANRGVKGREAGTALGIILRELQTKAIKNKDAFKEFGISVFDAEGNMRGIPEILRDMEGAFKGLTDEQKKEALMTLGFTDRSVGFIQAVLGSSREMAKYEKQLRRSGGATEEVANKQLNTFQNQMTIMWHKIQDVAISIGNKLLPGATELVKTIGNWIDENHELIATIAVGIFDAISKFIGLIVDVGGKLMRVLGPAFEFIMDIVGDFVNLFKAVFGEDGEGVGAITQFADQFGPFGDFVTDIFTRITDTITWVSENVFPAFEDAGAAVVGWFESNWPLISDVATTVFGGISSAFQILANVIGTVVPIIWGILEPVARFLFPLIGAAASAMLEVIRFVFKAVGVIWQAVADAAKVAADAIASAFRFLGGFFRGLWDGIIGVFKGAVNGIIEIINGFLGILNNIRIDIPRIQVGPVDIGGGSIDPFNIGLIPKLARGTRSWGGGIALVGEYGPELAYLPRGTDVYPSGQTRAMLGGSGDVTVTIRDPDHAIRRGGYSEAEIKRALKEGIREAMSGARHRSTRMATS